MTFLDHLVGKRLSAASIKHYIGAVRKLETEFLKPCFDLPSFSCVRSVAQLETIRDAILNRPEVRELNKRGNNMYSAGLRHYVEYVRASGMLPEKEFPTDVPHPLKPGEARLETITRYIRSTTVRDAALLAANYQCERNSRHRTFTDAMTNRPYMEGHHLIPMRCQEHFEVSLDVEANVLCLCPTCHRLMHHGTNAERMRSFDMFYEQRAERLQKVGITASRNELRELALRPEPVAASCIRLP